MFCCSYSQEARIVWLHRWAYRRGLLRSIRLPVRVVSVGNLTVGGSGKTPFVAWLALRLRARGEKVAILSRGVGGSATRGVNVVSDGSRVFLTPSAVGDEPAWLAASVRQVPVLAGQNRVALGLRASAAFGAEVLILDDGFQHHRLARDVDLVCIDGRVGFGNGHALPRGPLREPRSALRHADAIVHTRCPEDAEPIRTGALPGLPQFRVRIVPRRFRTLDGRTTLPCDALEGERVGLLAGIARPEGFQLSLERLGVEVARLVTYPDHHLYRPLAVNQFNNRAW